MSDPQQHHYIPETYLQHFCNAAERLWLYDKWEARSFVSTPGKVLKERFYYAQPDYANSKLNHGIEHFFSRTVEKPWPDVIDALYRRDYDDDLRTAFFTFMIALRVRVPSARKAIEYVLQQSVRTFLRKLRENGRLPDDYKMLSLFNEKLGTNYRDVDELYEAGAVQIKIDPHRSLLAMIDLAKGFAQLFQTLQPVILINRTDLDFDTSDNPVIYFPANQAVDYCTPYQYREGEPYEFAFPITRDLCLYHHSLQPRPPRPFNYVTTEDRNLVTRLNTFVHAFADRYVVSSSKFSGLIPNKCPRPVVYRAPAETGEFNFFRFEMEEPLKMPKWEYNLSSKTKIETT